MRLRIKRENLEFYKFFVKNVKNFLTYLEKSNIIYCVCFFGMIINGEQAVLKRKNVLLAACLICAAAVMLAGCTEGGRNYFETEGSGQAVESSDADRLGESTASDAEADENTVDIMFAPSGGYAADSDELEAVKAVLEKRLSVLGVEEYGLEIDHSLGQISLHCLASSIPDNSEELSARLCEKAELTFREGGLLDIATSQTAGGYEELPLVLDGSDVKQAFAYYNPTDGEYTVGLELEDSGAEKFSEATERLCKIRGVISIWLDDEVICQPQVAAHITDGVATISGSFTVESAKELADKINCGALPFDMEALKINTDF